jgi:protein SCO1/2
MSHKLTRLLMLGVLLFSMPLLVQPDSTIGRTVLEKKDLLYTCPMHPEVKSKTHGTCPKCGMALTKKDHTHAFVVGNESNWGKNYFPNLTLITQDGKRVRFYDDLLKGKLVAINLIYTSCRDLCPLETAKLAQVQKLLGDRVGKDIFFYSISIDPKHDKPEVLKAYAKKYNAGPGWFFLTGKPEDIELISKKLGLYSEPDPSNRDGHTPSLMIGNVPAGQWMKNGALDNPKFIALMIGQFMDSFRNDSGEVAKSYTEAPTLNLSKGKYLFSTRCAPCHTIGKGVGVGPDLLGVTRVRERAWLSRFITKPDEMLAKKDPLAISLFKKYNEVQMPNLRLADADAETLIDYLEEQTAASPSASHSTGSNVVYAKSHWGAKAK